MIKSIKRFFVITVALLIALVSVGTSRTVVHADEYYGQMSPSVGTFEKVNSDGSFISGKEPYITVNNVNVYCIDINAHFTEGSKTRVNLNEKLTKEQIEDTALYLRGLEEYVESRSDLATNQKYLLKQAAVWKRLNITKGWGYADVRLNGDDVPFDIQNIAYAKGMEYLNANKGKFECGGWAYIGENGSQDVAEFWTKPAKGKIKIIKASSNPDITNGNDCYSLQGAVYGIYQNGNEVGRLTTKADGTTDEINLGVGSYTVKEISAPKGYAIDNTSYTATVRSNQTATVNVKDKPTNDPIGIEIEKIDSDGQKIQGSAGLTGAEFTIKYYDGFYDKDTLPETATRTWVLQTKELGYPDGTLHYLTSLTEEYKVSGDDFYYNNSSLKPTIPLGTITVEETKAPDGYKLEGAYLTAEGSTERIEGLYVAQIRQNEDLAYLEGGNKVKINEKVIRGGVSVQKRDFETTDTKPQGSAALDGAEFNIINMSANPVVVDGKTYANGEVVKTIVTDINGKATTANDTLPYGHYKIVEVKAPKGYLNTGVTEREFDVKEDGVIVDMTGTDNSILNQIKRGDLEGIKIADTTHQRLAGVPFKITSKTTGESHIVVTDDNGYFSTAASWNPHTQNTNAGENAESGVWFGGGTPDDNKGALPYDTYTIEEMRSEGNQDFELIPPFDIIISRNNVTVDLGTLTDDYKNVINIHTIASVDGKKEVVAASNITITDKVSMTGLIVGHNYKLSGVQMLKDENTELIIDGKKVTGETEFTAYKTEMDIEVVYNFDGSDLGGKDLVTFEELEDVTNPDEPEKVAEHKDIEDEGQTITIKTRVIDIHTNATGINGEKELDPNEDVTIIDTVTLKGLEVGKEYTLTGVQMLKDSNAELIINGEKVTSEYTFVADSEEMEVKIEFRLNAKELAGKSIVTFEELRETGKDEPVAEHKDINDEGQTIRFKTSEKPRQAEEVKTGDKTNIPVFVATACLAGAIATLAIVRRKLSK